MAYWIFYILLLSLVSCLKPQITLDSKIQEEEKISSTVFPNSIFIAGDVKLTLRTQDATKISAIKIDGADCSQITVLNKNAISCIAPSATLEKTVDVVLSSTDGTSILLKDGLNYTTHSFTKIELFSGILSRTGFSNGIGTDARFNFPSSVVEYNGSLYIADTFNHVIRKMNLTSGEVEDFVGMKNHAGLIDANGLSAKFDNPMGLVVVGDNLYAADNGQCKIRKIDLITKDVITIAGKNKTCVDGDTINEDSPNGNDARLENVNALASDGTYLYLAGETSIIRRIALTGSYAVDTLYNGVDDDNALDTATNIIYHNNILYLVNCSSATRCDMNKIDISGAPPFKRITIAGGSSGSSDGIGAAAKFSSMGGIALVGDNIYITDTRNALIRKLNLTTNAVTTIAGSPSVLGNRDGIGAGTGSETSRLNRPAAITYANNVLYFTSLGNHNVRKLDPSNLSITTIAGKKD